MGRGVTAAILAVALRVGFGKNESNALRPSLAYESNLSFNGELEMVSALYTANNKKERDSDRDNQRSTAHITWRF